MPSPDPLPGLGSDRAPTHLIRAGESKTLCGIRWDDNKAYPQVDPRFVERNIIAHGWPVCPDCEAKNG